MYCNLKKLLVLFLIPIFISVSFFAEPYVESSELDTIIEGIKFGDNIITSGKGFLTYEFVYADSNNAIKDIGWRKDENNQLYKLVTFKYIRSEIFFAFKGPKSCCYEKTIMILNNGDKRERHAKMAYNGEKTDTLVLDPTGKKGLIRPKGIIDNGNKIDFNFDPRYNGINIFKTPINLFLKNNLCVNKNNIILDDVKFAGEVILDDILCKSFHGQNESNNVNIWLSPNMMYRPVKIEFINPSGVMIVNNKFRKNSNDIWFPKEIKSKTFINKSGEKILVNIRTLTVNNDFEINIDLPDSLFEINFPEGLEVFENRIH